MLITSTSRRQTYHCYVKTRKSVSAGRMIREVTKLLHKPRQLEDSPFKINVSPIVLKPESRSDLPHNMEDSKAIHVYNQERSTKCARIDPEKPSHPDVVQLNLRSCCLRNLQICMLFDSQQIFSGHTSIRQIKQVIGLLKLHSWQDQNS